jgi:MEKHLA domain
VSEPPLPFRDPACAARLALIASSYRRLIGSDLVAESSDLVDALWNAPAVILAHGREDDPRFFFANAAALVRFDADLDAMIGMPSRLSAEAPSRAERQALLDRVSRDGCITDYAGVRISLTGRRFRIEQAAVWNLIDADGAMHGQAAAFSCWTEL